MDRDSGLSLLFDSTDSASLSLRVEPFHPFSYAQAHSICGLSKWAMGKLLKKLGGKSRRKESWAWKLESRPNKVLVVSRRAFRTGAEARSKDDSCGCSYGRSARFVHGNTLC